MLFRLPEDIILVVWRDWLGEPYGKLGGELGENLEILKCLSSLDVACCSNSLREHFLQLIRHPFIQAKLRSVSIEQFDDVLGTLLWVSSRGVPLTNLHVTGAAARRAHALSFHSYPTSPSMQNLSFEGDVPADPLRNLLEACPNLSSLHVGDAGAGVHTTAVAFFSSPTNNPALKTISISVSAGDVPIPTDIIEAKLRQVGGSLESLALSGLPIADAVIYAIGKACSNLIHLRLCVQNASLPALTSMIVELVKLEQLEMGRFAGNNEDLCSMIANLHELRKLQCSGGQLTVGAFPLLQWQSDARRAGSQWLQTNLNWW